MYGNAGIQQSQLCATMVELQYLRCFAAEGERADFNLGLVLDC